jgi:hypothetical protein
VRGTLPKLHRSALRTAWNQRHPWRLKHGRDALEFHGIARFGLGAPALRGAREGQSALGSKSRETPRRRCVGTAGARFGLGAPALREARNGQCATHIAGSFATVPFPSESGSQAVCCKTPRRRCVETAVSWRTIAGIGRWSFAAPRTQTVIARHAQ